MTYGLDTSVVLHLLPIRLLKLANNAIVKVHRIQQVGDIFFVSDLVLFKTYFALQDYYGNTKENCLTVLKGFCGHSVLPFPTKRERPWRCRISTRRIWASSTG